MKLWIHSTLFVIVVLALSSVVAHLVCGDDWLGINAGCSGVNSGTTSIGQPLEIKWSRVLDPQTVPIQRVGSLRSKNIVVSSGEIYLIGPERTVVVIDLRTGSTVRSFPCPQLYRANAGDASGHDLRSGQFLVAIHDGLFYAKCSGDQHTKGIYRTDNGEVVEVPVIANVGANASGYFRLGDSFAITGSGGHTPVTSHSPTLITYDGQNIKKTDPSGLAKSPYYYTWSGPFLSRDNQWYALGALNNTDMTKGVRVLAHEVSGTKSVAIRDIKLPGIFVGIDSDLNSAPKPWCVGEREVYLAGARGVENYGGGSPSQFPIILTGMDRANGETWNVNLGLSANHFHLGSIPPRYVMMDFRPQIACVGEYVAVCNPATKYAYSRTGLSVVDVVQKKEIWRYEYPLGETTRIGTYHTSAVTKMILAGDAVYVAWLTSSTQLWPVVDSYSVSDLTLHVDRFAILDGTKTSSSFPLGVRGNTLQLDDFSAVDGRLFVLATTRESCWLGRSIKPVPGTIGGAQVVVAIGGSTGNHAPLIDPVTVTVTSPVLPATAELTAHADDSDGPNPVTYSWSQIGGPGFVTFSQREGAAAAAFSRPGTYGLRVSASDGDRSATQDVIVIARPPENTVFVNTNLRTISERGPGAMVSFIRTGPTQYPLTISYSGVGGSAVPGRDYQPLPGSIEIPAGSDRATVAIEPIDNDIVDKQRVIRLSITLDESRYVRGNHVEITLQDDEVVPRTLLKRRRQTK